MLFHSMLTELWGVLNNAGIDGAVGPVEFLQLKDYMPVMNINTFGLIDVTGTLYLSLYMDFYLFISINIIYQ